MKFTDDTLCVFCFRFANFEGDLSQRINFAKSGSGLNEYVTELFDSSLTWKDVKWLKRYRVIVNSSYLDHAGFIIAFIASITSCTQINRAEFIAEPQSCR